MKNIKFSFKVVSLFIVVVLSINITACYDYEPQFEGEYSDAENGSEDDSQLPKQLVVVAGGDVYLADEFGEDMEAITSGGNVTVASINNDHTKVLYKRDGEEISIYNLQTESVEGTVSGSASAEWFDYHPNNETVYFLTEDGVLKTVGPPVLVQNSIDLKEHLNIIGNIVPQGVVLLQTNGFVYSYYNSSTFFHGLIHSNGESLVEINSNTGSAKFDLRINVAENLIYTATSGTDRVVEYGFPSLGLRGYITDATLAVPISEDRYYAVTENNFIEVPLGENVPSPNGVITAIDF